MATQTLLTPEDLEHMPPPESGGEYELSHGELIVTPMATLEHDDVKSEIGTLLRTFANAHRLGRVLTEATFKIGDGSRKPDVAFLGNAKWATIGSLAQIGPFAPDLAVEVISSCETRGYSKGKLQDYFAAGVAEVWQVYPDDRDVVVHTANGRRLLSGDQIIETPLLPGFSVPISRFFPAM